MYTTTTTIVVFEVYGALTDGSIWDVPSISWITRISQSFYYVIHNHTHHKDMNKHWQHTSE